MEPRRIRHAVKQSKIKKIIISNSILFLGLFLSIFIYGSSIVLWGKVFKGTPYFELLEGLFTINFQIIGIFIMLGYVRIRYVNLIFESIVKILFTVWIVVIFQFSTKSQLEQNAWIVTSAFTFIYLEVLLKINDYFYDMNEFQNKRIKFLNKQFVQKLSVPLSIVSLAIINALISLAITDLLTRI